MPEFAPGIPLRLIQPIREIGKEGPNEIWAFSLSRHDAKKAGRHYDLRLVDPETEEAHSWALPRAKLPEPGEKVLAVPQPTHTREYAERRGEWVISGGYGAGKVKSEMFEPTEVVEATPRRIQFNLYGPGQRVGQFSIIRGKDQDLLVNHSPTGRQIGGARGYVVPSEKPKFHEIDFDRVDPTNDAETMKAKIDGAHVIIGLQSGKPARVFSYRPSKRQPVIEHTHRWSDWHQRTVPPGLGGTILRAEAWASDQYGRALSPEQIGGLLNTDVWTSRLRQEQDGVKLRLTGLDVVQHLGRPSEGLNRDRKAAILGQASKTLDWLELPTTATTAAAKRKLLRAIKAGKLKETSEGVVLYPEEGTPIKAKITPEYDGKITGTYPGRGRHEGKRIGGFLVKDEQGVTNRVGGGLSDKMRRKAFEDPGLFKGLVMKIKSRGHFEGSGKLRDPRFMEFHLDKNDPEKLEAIEKLALRLRAARAR